MPEVPTDEEIAEIRDPKTRLLHSGARILIDGGFDVLADGLNAEAVTKRAGRSRRVFYDHFDSKEQFTREMLLEFLKIEDHSILGEVFEDGFRDLVIAAEGNVVESVHAICDAFYNISTLSNEPQVHAIAWSLARTDPAILEALREFEASIDDMYERMMTGALKQWNQTMKRPWTVASLTTILRSMIDGLYARNRVNEGAIDLEFFEQCILTLITGILQPTDDAPEHFDDALRSISRRTATEWRERNDPQTMQNTRQQILDAVVPALETAGLGGLSFEAIADVAAVSIAVIRDAFPTVEHVVCEAIECNLPPLAREAAFDIQTASLSPKEVLSRHLTRVARWAQSNSLLASAVIAGPMVRSRNSADDPTMSLLRSVAEPAIAILDHAKSEGQIYEDIDTVPTAALLTHAVVSRAATRPQEHLSKSVAWLVDLVLYGTAIGSRPTAVIGDAK